MSQSNLDTLQQLLREHQAAPLEDGFLIAFFIDRVCVGRYENGRPILPEPGPDWQKLLQLHIFNELGELRLIKTHQGNWLARHLIEDQDKKLVRSTFGGQSDELADGDWIDEDLLIIGNDPGKLPADKAISGDFVTCGEAGRRVTLPREALGKRIRVRNYLRDVDFLEQADGAQTGQAQPPLSALQVRDYRFVGFYGWEGGEA